jgi:hypothetical protein
VGRIAPHKKGRRRQFQRLVQDPRKKGNEPLLAVLGAISQFYLHEPPFQGKVCGNRGIAVKPLVGTGYSLLPGVGIVHGENVDVQWDVTGGKNRHQSPGALDKFGDAIVDDCLEAFCMLIEPLSERPLRGNGLHCQGLFEKAVCPKAGYGFVIALAQAKKPDERFHNISMGYSAHKGSNRSQPLTQRGKAV